MIKGRILIALSILLITTASVKLYLNYSAQLNIKEHRIVRNDLKVLLYTKDMCKYCILAKELLREHSVPFEVIELENNMDLHKKIATQTGQNTVPYIYINDKFIGGYGDLEEFKKSGKFYLETKLKNE